MAERSFATSARNTRRDRQAFESLPSIGPRKECGMPKLGFFSHTDHMAVFQHALSSLLIVAAGCATAAPAGGKAPLYGGDMSGEASIDSLPALDVDDSAMTSEMRIARMLSAESLSFPDPERPTDTSAAAIQAWSDDELKPWVEVKQKRAAAARAELDRAAVQNHRQRIMAGALVGLVYEDVARVLMSVPVPDDLKQEPEIAKMFLDVIASHAGPYLTQSKRAYDACAQNAVAPETMQHWSGFCEGRSKRLPAPEDIAKKKLGAGPTEVTVVSR